MLSGIEGVSRPRFSRAPAPNLLFPRTLSSWWWMRATQRSAASQSCPTSSRTQVPPPPLLACLCSADCGAAGGWRLLYRGETEIASMIASLSDKLQLKVPHLVLLPHATSLDPHTSTPAGRPYAHSQAVRRAPVCRAVFRALMLLQHRARLPRPCSGVSAFPPYSTPFPPPASHVFCAARMKTFQPELPEIAGKNGPRAPPLAAATGSCGSSLACRSQGEETCEKGAKRSFEGETIVPRSPASSAHAPSPSGGAGETSA